MKEKDYQKIANPDIKKKKGRILSHLEALKKTL